MKSITRYVADDGSEHESERAALRQNAKLRGLEHECPKCKGAGTMPGDPITRQERDYEAEAFQGQFASPVWRTVTLGHHTICCNVCNGHGYTAKKVEPIIETRVIGYR